MECRFDLVGIKHYKLYYFLGFAEVIRLLDNINNKLNE